MMRKVLAFLLTLIMTVCMATMAFAEAVKKPVIGITWKSTTQNYAGFKKVIETAGGAPVELVQVISNDVKYDKDGAVVKKQLEKTGMLKQKYANKIKARDYDSTNVAEALKGVDAVFFTGGEDISPSLFKVPVKEANKGETINATRDISDYVLMAYCIDNNIPCFAVCRGEQMMGIVSGTTFIQDIPQYYEDKGIVYHQNHRMPPGTPNRTYERHDVELTTTDSHLYKIVGSMEIKNVSSWHHQSVGSLEGTELIQTAKAVYDGVEILEGIENPNKDFCVGVQFHPENDVKLVVFDGKTTPADYEICLNFFKALVAAASK